VTLFTSDPTPAAPTGPLVRVRMVVAYHGASFHGFAANEGVVTVAGTLARALETVLRRPVTLVGAGRTDAGVHAWGQVVSFDAPDTADLAGLAKRVNSLCGPAVAVRAVERAEPGFDARHSARWRQYRYTVLARPEPDPFLADRAWHVRHPLELSVLRLATDPFIGEHDFSSFCKRPKVDGPPPSLQRRVLDAGWTDLGDGVLRFEVRANAFCHQMVRSIVGTLVDVGLGRRRPGDVLAILRACDRGAAGTVAPPHGLCLWEVGYGPVPDPIRPLPRANMGA